MNISIVVAAADNGAIGKDNHLLWHLPADLKFFKQVTMGHPIIMGRKTFDAIGKPLPGRTSIIITKNKTYEAKGCIVVHSVEEAIAEAKKLDTDEACIIGGAEIYRQAMDLANKIYLTQVHVTLDGDAYFEIQEKEQWHLVSEKNCYKDAQHPYDYTFLIYNRKITPSIH